MPVLSRSLGTLTIVKTQPVISLGLFWADQPISNIGTHPGWVAFLRVPPPPTSRRTKANAVAFVQRTIISHAPGQHLFVIGPFPNKNLANSSARTPKKPPGAVQGIFIHGLNEDVILQNLIISDNAETPSVLPATGPFWIEGIAPDE